MISDEKLRHVLNTLLKRSQEDEVAWTSEFGQAKGTKTYAVVLPKSQIWIGLLSPPHESDFIAVRVMDAQGEISKEWQVREDETDWDLFSGLWSEADRCVTGWDKILDDIESSLEQPGRIGRPATSVQSASPLPQVHTRRG